jgi:hypothetical protein
VRPDRKGLRYKLSATATRLRGEACRDFDDPRASFPRFALKYLNKSRPARIIDGESEVMVLDHAFYVQIFDDDGTVPVHVPPRHFMQEILALACCLQMKLRRLPDSFFAPLGAFLTAARLSLCELFLRATVVFRVFSRVAFRVGEEHLQAYVKSDGLSVTFGRSIAEITHDDGVPIAFGSQLEIDGLGCALEGAVHLDLDGPPVLPRNSETPILNPGVATRTVLTKLDGMPAVESLEARKTRTLLVRLPSSYTPSESFIESVGKRLDCGSRHVFASATLKTCGECIFEEETTCPDMMVSDLPEHLVVQLAAFGQTRKEKLALLTRRIESVFKRFDHLPIYTVLGMVVHPLPDRYDALAEGL